MRPKVSTFILSLLVMTLIPLTAKAVDMSGYCGDPNVNEGKDVSWILEANPTSPNTYTLIISGNGATHNFQQPYGGYQMRPWEYSIAEISHVIVEEGVTHLGNNALFCSSVRTFSFPNSLKSIGESTFYGCYNLTSIDIPGTVETIGTSAFGNCENLEEITLHRGLQSIGKNAFKQYNNSTKLKSITIPSTVISIGEYAFENCTGLSEIILEEGLTVFGGFKNVGVTEVVIPSSVTTVNANALNSCPNLKKIVIGEGVTSLSDNPFPSNPNLEMIVCLPTTVPAGYRPFYGFSKRFVMVVPAEAYDAYHDEWYDVRNNHDLVIGGVCGDLTWTYNPSTKALSLLGEGAMPDYEQINEVPWNVYAQEITSFSISSGVTHVSASAFKSYPALNTITVEDGNETYSAENNCLIQNATSSLVLGCNGSTIPTSIATIKHGAFNECSALTNIAIPANVTCVEGGAFMACPIEAISVDANNYTYYAEGNCLIETASKTLVLSCVESEIPTTTIMIGNYSFACCNEISSIILPENITTIGEYAFFGCTELSEVYSYAAESPSIKPTTFENINPEPILYHPSGSDYSTWAPYFKELKYIAKELETIIDGSYEIYDNSFDMPVNTLIYSRTLPNLHWNALYVPFKIPYATLADDYEVAYINAVHSYDNDDDGTIDELSMEVMKIKAGTLKANYPYLIKARNEAAKAMTISVADAVLYAAEENTLDCSSVYQTFEISGSYSRKNAEDLEGSLAISTEGAWQPLATGTYLNPFRLYLTITNRDDSPVEVEPAALSRVRIIENGETTGILDLTPAVKKETHIFDLSGRRVLTPQKGQLYIVNGKKVVY